MLGGDAILLAGWQTGTAQAKKSCPGGHQEQKMTKCVFFIVIMSKIENLIPMQGGNAIFFDPRRDFKGKTDFLQHL